MDIHSLRAITGQIEAKLVIFVEDRFAVFWTKAILRQYGNIAVDHIEVYAMEGDGIAVSMNRHHNKNPAIPKPSICIIDGDSSQKDISTEYIYRFPGEAPETSVFQEVLTAWDKFGGKLSVALLQSFESAANVKSVCEEIKLSNVDPHLIYSQIGERLGLIPDDTVAQAFTAIWSQAYPDRVRSFLDQFKDKIPMNQSGA